MGSNVLFATRAMFLCAGLSMAACASLFPLVKTSVGANDAVMGALLFCLGGGAMVAMPISGMLVARFGCRLVMVVSICLFSLALSLLPHATSLAQAVALLLVFGAGLGATDCIMNIQGAMVAKEHQRNLMSGFHGFYSLGGIVGAGLMVGLLKIGLGPALSCLVITAFTLLMLVVFFKGLLPTASDEAEKPPLIAIPRGRVLIIGLICFCFFMAEGTVMDWSGVYLTEYHHMPLSLSAMGLFFFSITMTLGRMTGEWIINTLGELRVLLLGGVSSSLGLVTVVMSDQFVVMMLGYAVIGLGCSNIVPIMFSAAGKQQDMPQSLAIPAVSTLGYLGVLAGPALVGQVSNVKSLPFALLSVVGLMIFATLLVFKGRV